MGPCLHLRCPQSWSGHGSKSWEAKLRSFDFSNGSCCICQLDSIGFISVVLFMFYLCSIYVLFMFYLFSSADCFDSVAVRCKCIRFVCIILYIYYSPPFPPAEKSGKFLIRWKNSFTTEARTKAQSFLALSSRRTWSSAKVLPHKPRHQLIKHPTNQPINKSTNQIKYQIYLSIIKSKLLVGFKSTNL
jgi:hypothetical protein